MNWKKRLISVVVICIFLVAIVILGTSLIDRQAENTGIYAQHKDTIHLWYTDEALTDYLNKQAVAFYEETDVRVDLTLVSGLEYLEEINKASLEEDEIATPDLYIVTNDSLEKAYLAGLASEIQNTQLLEDTERFSDTARHAVQYQGKYVAYPFYYETASLLYNKTYLEEIAASAEEAVDPQSLIPASIVDVLNFGDMYSTPEHVEYFFRWDVSDILYNYFFIGNYLTVGGDTGDDAENINIYNVGSIASLKVYQEMNQFFSIDTSENNYDAIMQEFVDGRTIYTIATSDCIRTLTDAQKDGSFPYEFGVAQLPDINNELRAESMSVTNAFVVNGYSTQKEYANAFITYLLTQDRNCELYDMAGKLPAQIQKTYSNDYIQAFQDNYEMSMPIPKMLATSNFWMELEACFAKVWNGADANQELREISEKIKTQISGVAFTETPLDDPKIELLPVVEYEDSGEME